MFSIVEPKLALISYENFHFFLISNYFSINLNLLLMFLILFFLDM